jgi:hypothetical protein
MQTPPRRLGDMSEAGQAVADAAEDDTESEPSCGEYASHFAGLLEGAEDNAVAGEMLQYFNAGKGRDVREHCGC